MQKKLKALVRSGFSSCPVCFNERTDSPFFLSPSLLHSSHLVGQDVDSLLQVAIFRVQQRRLLALKGAVGVGVLPKLADHGELWEHKDTK